MKDEIKAIEPRHFRSIAVSDTSVSSTLSATVRYRQNHQFSTTHISHISFISVPSPVLPKKIANFGCPQTHTSEEADEIRFTFHLLLSQKLYLITQCLLDYLMALHPNFPVTSTTSL